MWNWGGLHQLSSPEADISQFDCDHIGEHMEMLCCGNQSEQGNYWMLMKDTSTGKLYIYKYKFVIKSLPLFYVKRSVPGLPRILLRQLLLLRTMISRMC